MEWLCCGLKTKHQVEIHALVHDKSTVLTLDARKKKRPEELSMRYCVCIRGWGMGSDTLVQFTK